MTAKLPRGSQSISLDDICFDRDGRSSQLIEYRPRSGWVRLVSQLKGGNEELVGALPNNQRTVAFHAGKMISSVGELRIKELRSESISCARRTAHGARLS